MIFQEGQRFVVLRDVEAKCFVHLGRSLSELRTVTVRAGEVLVVSFARPSESSVMSCRPHRYEALGIELVDRETRENPGYEGYSLVIESTVVAEKCRRLDVGT